MPPERTSPNDPDPVPAEDRRHDRDGEAGDRGRWPLPLRAAIALGGAAALWGVILLALR